MIDRCTPIAGPSAAWAAAHSVGSPSQIAWVRRAATNFVTAELHGDGAGACAVLTAPQRATVHNRTYPMIRFGTGDLTVITDEPCRCGRTSARMLGWRGRADEVTKVRAMFIRPRQADEIVARVKGVTRHQVVVGREGHNDTLTLRVELGAGADAHAVAAALEAAIRDVMKLRGIVAVVAAGTIPENAKKISDERKWD